LVPAQRLADAVCAGAVDAVTFTSAPAVDAFLEIAGDRPVARAFATSVLPVCIGPVCVEAAHAHGLARTVQPDRALLGAMVNTVVDALAAQQLAVATSAGELVFRGASVVVDGAPIVLSDRERAVLRALARRPGSVVPKAVLLREVWGDDATDEHALEVTVGRLRRRLGDAGSVLRTVVRRGYVLAID
jgi:uroporphyrinogen-III synthase